MCGICGFANYKNEPLLKAMMAALTHRGPDEDGFFEVERRVGLGMRRLKIIDLATGSQPISNEDSTVTVVFNGEIYNFKELKGELEGKGHKFRTASDTEVLVHMYEEYGRGFVARLRGMFAFAIWDSRQNALMLARDQFGIKPLFYAISGDRLFFASEIKSLLLCPEISDDLDAAAMDAYFTCLYIPAPLTVYKNIKKLEPAQYLVFQNGRSMVETYWRVPVFADKGFSEERYLREIDELLGKSIKEQLMADVPLGLLLSGGMDSSTALYYMSKFSSGPVKTFSVGYGPKDRSFNETAQARLLAGYFKSEHHEKIVEPDVRAVMERLAEQFDEPFADASAIPTYLVTKEARSKVAVALTGIGGDEMFGGYPRYLGARLLQPYLKLPGILRQGIWAGAKYLPESSSARNIPGRIKRFLRGGSMDFRDGYISWLSYFDRVERARLYGSGLANALGVRDHEFNSTPSAPDDILAFETRNYLSDDLLCLADRTSMANSLELRVPFLDTRIAELMAGVPLAMKTRGFKLKYLLKKVMSGRLPPEIIAGAKRGFQVPLARWYTADIKGFAREVLSPSALKKSGFLAPEYASGLLEAHESGRRNLADQLYASMMFELWASKRKTMSGAKVLPVAIELRDAPKILLVNMAGLGDIVMMTPLLRALKHVYPASKISLLTIDRSAELARRLPGIDEVFSVPIEYKIPGPMGFMRFMKALWTLRERRFDVMINMSLVSSAAGALKARFVKIAVQAGFSIGRTLDGHGGIYDAGYSENFVENRKDPALSSRLLEPLGIEMRDLDIRLEASQKDMAFAETEWRRLGLAGSTVIGFNPGAFRPSRRWPLENWKELARLMLAAYPGVKIVVSGSAQELESYAGLNISDRVIMLNGKYDMGKLMAMMKKMDLFITNDTGPMHIAAALGVKVAAIFGPGDFRRFAPAVPEAQYRIIRKDIAVCSVPCYEFECKNPVCLTSIVPAEVFQNAKELLDGK